MTIQGIEQLQLF